MRGAPRRILFTSELEASLSRRAMCHYTQADARERRVTE